MELIQIVATNGAPPDNPIRELKACSLVARGKSIRKEKGHRNSGGLSSQQEDRVHSARGAAHIPPQDRNRHVFDLRQGGHGATCVAECMMLLMPQTADQYRRAAEEAKQLAEKATDSWERVQLMRLARQWARLADYKARLEAKPPRRSN